MSKKMLFTRLVLTAVVISGLVPTAVSGNTIDLKPRFESLWTGSVKKGTAVEIIDGPIYAGHHYSFPQNYTFRGYAAFDLGDLPSNACISAVRLDGVCFVAGGSLHELEIRRLLDYPVGAPVTTLFNNIKDGIRYNWTSSAMRTSGVHSVSIVGLVEEDLEAAAQGSGLRWFAVGFTEKGENDQTGVWQGWTSDEPVLHVTYTVPVQTSPTLSISTDTACIGDQFCVSWNSISGATSYEIRESGGAWLSVGLSTSKCYIKPNAGTHVFDVRAVNSCGIGPVSQSVSIKLFKIPVAPFSVWTDDEPLCATYWYRVNWSAVTGADSYEIREDFGNWANAGNKTWMDFNHSSAGTHRYAVRAVSRCGTGPTNNSINYYVLDGSSDPPIISSGSNTCPDQLATISWSPTANATKYRLTDSTNGVTVYTGTDTFWRDTHAAGSYEYWVQALNGCFWSTAGGPYILNVKQPLSPPGAPLSDLNPAFVDEDYSISWDSVPGATYYELWENGTELIFSGYDFDNPMNKNSAGDFNYSIRACDECGCSVPGPELSLSVGVHTSVEEIEALSLPDSYSLDQNYPNPFNPETRIEFSLKRAGHVELTVYNILGESIRTLVSEYLPAGYKATTWDGNDNSGQPVSSGVYLYRLTTDEYAATKKMMLVK